MPERACPVQGVDFEVEEALDAWAPELEIALDLEHVYTHRLRRNSTTTTAADGPETPASIAEARCFQPLDSSCSLQPAPGQLLAAGPRLTHSR